jgi:hypothetical protein
MENLLASGITFDGPARYRILVKGSIPGNWKDRLDGMSICPAAAEDEVTVTTLEGELADQAALAGVIDTLYELHLPILLVKRVGTSQEAESDLRETDTD